jgi:hypothetical protein
LLLVAVVPVELMLVLAAEVVVLRLAKLFLIPLKVIL